MAADEMPCSAYKQHAFTSAMSMLPPFSRAIPPALSFCSVYFLLVAPELGYSIFYHTVASFIAKDPSPSVQCSNSFTFPLILYGLMLI
ncbi:hypothetical protein ACH3XW_30835 [Acanthocheilonema viteae]